MIDKLEDEISNLNQQINAETSVALSVQKRADFLHDQCKLFESLKEEEIKQYQKHIQEVNDFFTSETSEGKQIKTIEKQINDLRAKIQEQDSLIQKEAKKHQLIHSEIQTVSNNIKKEEKKKQDHFKQQQQKEQKEKQIRSQIDYHQTSMAEKMQEREELELAISQMQDELLTLTSETNTQIQKRDAFCKKLKQLENEDFY